MSCEWGAEWHLMTAKLPTHTESTCTPPTFKQAIAHTQTHTSDTVTAVVTRRSFTRPCAWSTETILSVTLNNKEWRLMKPSWERRKEEAYSHLSDVESPDGLRVFTCRTDEPRVLGSKGNRGTGNNCEISGKERSWRWIKGWKEESRKDKENENHSLGAGPS